MMPAKQYDTGLPLSILLGGDPQLETDPSITGLTVDSRRVEPGWAFMALAGHQHHGLQFAEPAVRAGAAVVIYDPAGDGEALADSIRSSDEGGVLLAPVSDLSDRLGEMASVFYGEPSQSLSVMGVTGTNGKTSCSHFIAEALSEGQSAAVVGTLGWGVPGQLQATANTTPDAVSVQAQLAQLLDQGVRHVAMEVSSHGMEQGRVNGVRFVTAVFTNLSRDHLDYHGSMAAYGDAKRRLFATSGLQSAVINLADDYAATLLQTVQPQVQTWGYSREPLTNAPAVDHLLQASNVQLDDAGLRFTVTLAEDSAQVRTGLIGLFNVDNVLATLAVLMIEGLTLDQAADRVAALTGIPGRMERFGQVGVTPTVIVDYAHTDDALKNALTSLRPHCQGRLITVFGCGGDRDAGKRPLMGRVAEQYSDQVWITDDNPRSEEPGGITKAILAGMENPKRATVIHDRQQAISEAIQTAQVGDVVLVAGKGHEATQQRGDVLLPFSDRDCVRECLSAGGNPPQGEGGWKP